MRQLDAAIARQEKAASGLQKVEERKLEVRQCTYIRTLTVFEWSVTV